MLKIDKNGYHPHVRNVLWENNGPVANTSLSQADFDQWTSAELKMANNFLEVKIANDSFSYSLPSYSNAHREANGKFRV